MKIKTTLKIVLASLVTTLAFSSAKALSFESDVPANIQQQMQEDLGFINQIQGNGQTPFHGQIYGGVDGGHYQSFFESHIDSIGMNQCGYGNAVACVIPWQGKTMFLTQNFIKFSHPQIARLMIVFHEARHTEGNHGNWGHDTCPRPFLDENGHDKVSIWTGAKLEAQPACDSTPFGSYGSSTIMLKNIAKFCTNCNSKVRMDADMYGNDQLGRIDNDQAKQAMLNDFNGVSARRRR